MKKTLTILLLLTLILNLSSCADDEEEHYVEKQRFFSLEKIRDIGRERCLSAKKHREKSAKITFVGDVMVHSGQMKKADKGDHFDFSPCFFNVKNIISDSDYAVCNVETTFAGANKGRKTENMYKGYSGYPHFNSPSQLAQALKDTGFDMALLANNHTLDNGISGVNSTIDEIISVGMEHIGTRKSPNEKAYKIKDINGMKVGFINYTYGMNGFKLPEDKQYAINNLGNYDEQYINKMLEQVKAMVAEDTDFNIALMHFGKEYDDYPSEKYQKDIVNKLFNTGIDAVIGAHPHVLQPIHIVEKDGRKKLVAYSLGNFISSQINKYTKKPTDFGAILELEIEKLDSKKANIKSVNFIPTYSFRNSENYYVIPALNIPQNINLTAYDNNRLQHLKEIVIDRVLRNVTRDSSENGVIKFRK